MKGWSHQNPEAAAPGEIVGIYPVTLTREESELIANQLFAANQDFPISHYMKEKYFLELLDSSAFSTKRLDLCDDDPLEGRYPDANRQALAAADAQWMQQANAKRDIEAFLQSQAIHRTHCYAHCWFGILEENGEMWERYGDGCEGVCLVSSTRRLLGSVVEEASVAHELGKVTYWPDNNPLPELHSSTVMFRNQPKFSAENEVRLLSQIKMDYLPTDSDGFLSPCPERLTVRVNLDVLVAAIILGPSMNEESRRHVIDVTQLKIPRAKILRSRFDVRR
jgi:hypothetical protein